MSNFSFLRLKSAIKHILIISFCFVGLVSLLSCSNNTEKNKTDRNVSVKKKFVEQEVRTVIEMDKENGVYTIPASINGLKLHFVFDTGASDVCISLSEAFFMLKNNYLNRDDLMGSSYAQIADGSITENTSVKINSIEIGGLEIKDVSAQIVHNLDAPLLLGQSAIQKLGKIELNGDSLIIIRKVKKEIQVKEEKSAKAESKSEDKDQRSTWEKIKDFLGVHNYQADLDSLILLSNSEYKDDDYFRAKRHIEEAETMAENQGIKDRQWEILYLKALILGEFEDNISASWRTQMRLLYKAYKLNGEKKDGKFVTYKKLNHRLCNGISQGFTNVLIDENKKLVDSDKLFYELIEDLSKTDEYSAYCYLASYYSLSNISVSRNYCQKAIELNPKKPQAYIKLGVMYFEGNDYYNCIKTCRKVLDMDISDKDKGYLHRMLALCYDEDSYNYVYNLRVAAKYNDVDAIYFLKENGLWGGDLD